MKGLAHLASHSLDSLGLQTVEWCSLYLRWVFPPHSVLLRIFFIDTPELCLQGDCIHYEVSNQY